ncbi:MAG TPA: NAD(P)/FAD-dependent oxidoreductase [Thermoleophilaceae bacterium]
MVVVIGAGHNGLVAAVRLAAAGVDVTVLEAADAPGGGVRSDALTLPGFIHDTCSGFFPLTAASPAFRALELDVDWVNPERPMAHVFEDGSAISLLRDLDATAAVVGEPWRRLVKRLCAVRSPLIRAALGRFPPVRPLIELGKEAVLLAPLAPLPSSVLGRRLFGDDDRRAAWLAGSGAHADIPPSMPGSGAFSLGLNFLGHLVGWPFPRGGAQGLTDALVERLRWHGGEVRCGVEVRSIEELKADAVLCTASPAVLMRLVPEGALPGRLRRWDYGLGTLKLDYGLRGPVPWLSDEARRAAVVHVGGPLDEIAGSLDQAIKGEFPSRPVLVVGQHTLFDSSRAPAGQHTLYVYARVPQRPGLSSDEMAERVEARIERFAPGFRSTVLARSIRTPAEIERDNPSMAGGDLASGSLVPQQQLMFRPHPRLCRYRTPLDGLYVAGGWVYPGPGVHGMPGWNAAQTILEDLRGRSRS